MRNLLALISTLGLIGCVGSVDDGIDPTIPVGPNPTEADLTPAKRLFDQNVYPVINAKCSGGACHSDTALGTTLTRFVATDSTKGWQTAINYVGLVGTFTTQAPILTRITPDGAHKGMKYTADETTKITEWLAKEVELRNGQPNTPTGPGGESLSAAVDRVMSQFAGCMTLANFQTANLGAAWANLNSNEGQCKRCHANGEASFIANQDNPTAYSIISTKKMFWLVYFTVDLTQGAAAAKVAPNTVSFGGVYNRTAPHQTHPTFQYPNNAGTQALTNFYNLTVQEIGKGTCQPKPLENL